MFVFLLSPVCERTSCPGRFQLRRASCMLWTTSPPTASLAVHICFRPPITQRRTYRLHPPRPFDGLWRRCMLVDTHVRKSIALNLYTRCRLAKLQAPGPNPGWTVSQSAMEDGEKEMFVFTPKSLAVTSPSGISAAVSVTGLVHVELDVHR